MRSADYILAGALTFGLVGSNDVEGSAADQFVESLTSGLRYWRATGGLSLRW